MKNIFRPLPLGMILLLTLITHNACKESNLDLKPANLTEETFFTKSDEVEMAVRGIYSKFTDYYWYNSVNFVHSVWLLPGDDITTTGSNAFEVFGTLNATNGSANQYFQTSYNIIRRTNSVLEKIDEVPYTDESLKKSHRGEALFLRAWVYFHLWNFYGTAPLITERAVTVDKLNPTNSKDTELLDQAIKDLEEATGLLPTSWNDANRGRVTQNSANGLLGKVLVFRATVKKSVADYQAAIAAFNNIAGAALETNFADNFSAATENNKESLFEFQASQSNEDNVWLNNDFDNTVGAMSAYWGFYSGHWSLFGTPTFIATDKLINAFEPGDPRKDTTLAADGSIKKYVINDKPNTNGVGSLNNPRLLRYADVLLLKAEAILNSGGSTTEAIKLINQVRARARNMSKAALIPVDRSEVETDQAKIMQWIIDERFVELAGEGHRWPDLRRWQLAGKVSLNNAFFSSQNTSINFDASKNLVFPIPTGEIDLNPSITQNPGY